MGMLLRRYHDVKELDVLKEKETTEEINVEEKPLEATKENEDEFEVEEVEEKEDKKKKKKKNKEVDKL